jgi:hypothetical protein
VLLHRSAKLLRLLCVAGPDVTGMMNASRKRALAEAITAHPRMSNNAEPLLRQALGCVRAVLTRLQETQEPGVSRAAFQLVS